MYSWKPQLLKVVVAFGVALCADSMLKEARGT